VKLSKSKAAKPVAILIGLLWLGDVVLAEEVEARINWYQKAALSVPVNGVVAEIKVQAGDRVKAGDVLLSLDARVFQAQSEYAMVNLKYQERLNKEAKQELERNIELYERTLLSNHELEAAHIQYEKSLAAFSHAKKTAALAEYELHYSKITAPFDGVVVALQATPGQTVVSSQTALTLLEVAATDTMAAEFVVTGSALPKVKMGTKVTILVGKSRIKATVSEVAYEPFPQSNRYAVKVKFSSKGQFYRTGRKVTVVLP